MTVGPTSSFQRHSAWSGDRRHLKRLVNAIGLAGSKNLFIDEVNDGHSDLLVLPTGVKVGWLVA